MLRRTLLAPLAAWILLFAPAVAGAATILVTTTSDAVGLDGRCSLREAIDAANTDTAGNDCTAGFGADEIVLDFDSTVTIALAGANEDGNLTGDFDVTEDLVIRTLEPNPPASIDGGGLDRVFHVFEGVELTLERVRVIGGDVINFGGGILVLGTTSNLELRDSQVRNNRASIFGGGIFSEGPVLLHRSQVESNTAASGGGVYISNQSPLTLERSRLAFNNALADGGGANLQVLLATDSAMTGNDAERHGGGVFFRSGGSSSDVSQLTNTTIAENACLEDGGGIYHASPGILDLHNVSVAWNAADSDSDNTGDGGGVFVLAGQVRPRNSVFGFNEDRSPGMAAIVAPDCAGTVSSLGYNLFSVVDASGCTITGTTVGNLVGSFANPIDPELNCVSFDGSEPGIVRPRPISPVIDAGNPAGCLGPSGTPLTADQRGHLRPWDGPDPGLEPRCDMGAVEAGAPGPGFFFGDGFETGDTTAWGPGPQPPAPFGATSPWAEASVGRAPHRGGCLNPE
ncbi:MAG: CSLREA domain-containing protein [Holophagales bacterium]|nr:CSLREA domain-containing protein [Holophagales bacterium]